MNQVKRQISARRRKHRLEMLEDRRLLAVLLTESFESGSLADLTGDSGLVSAPEAFHNSDDDFWIRTNGSNPLINTASTPYSGQDGNFYWAGEDLDDTGGGSNGALVKGDGADTKELFISGISIVGHENLTFDGLFAADGDTSSTGPVYDAGEGFQVDYRIDGGAWVTGLEFRSEEVPGSFNGRLLQDTDFNGVGDGAELTASFTEYGFAITGTGSTLDLRVIADLDASSEEAAFDRFMVEGDPVSSNSGPAVGSSNIPDVGEEAIGLTQYQFSVTYTDATEVDESTIDVNDVSIVGPGGPLVVAGVAIDPVAGGPVVTATYTVTAPGGSWDATDNGVYSIALVDGQVGDIETPPAFNSGQALGDFVADLTNTDPVFESSLILNVIAGDQGDATHPLVLRFRDPGLFDEASVGTSDITVTGPGGAVTVSGASVLPSSGNGFLEVEYTINAPGGTWDDSDDGTYNVAVVANEILDAAGADVAAGQVVSFVADSGILVDEGFETQRNVNDFTGDSALVVVTDHFHNSSDDFWIRTDGAEPPIGTEGESSGSPSYTGQQGDFYWAGEDLDDTGAEGDGRYPGGDNLDTKQLLISGVDITGFTDLGFSGLFAADGDGRFYDDLEGLLVEYRIDGGAWNDGLAFAAESGTNVALRLDTNFDGVGDGAELTPTFTSFGFLIGSTGSSLDLRVTADLDAANEEIAFDQLRVAGTPASSNTAPVVTNIVAPPVEEPQIGATSYSFDVIYSDSTGLIDVSTIDVNDVTVTGPSGGLTVTGVSVSPSTDASPVTATYTVTPPGGSWDAADVGTYTIGIVGNQVSDDDASPLFVAADANAATFDADPTNQPPEVFQIIANDVIASDFGATTYTLTVVLDDLGGIDAGTIGAGDVTIEDGGGSVVATSLSGNVTSTVGTLTFIEYTFTPPGGSWDAGDIDTYSVNMVANEVLDVAGLALAAIDDVGTFDVDNRLLASESFETGDAGGDSGLLSAPAAFHNSPEDFWIRTDGENPLIDSENGATPFNAGDGRFYWAGEDVDDTVADADGEFPGGDGSPIKTVQLVNVDIAGFENLSFDGLFGANGTTGAFEGTDALDVLYSVDGGSEQLALSFRPPAGTNEMLLQDTDFDGVGDGTALGATFASFGFNIAETGSQLTVTVRANAAVSSEEIAFDDLRILGDRVTTPVNLSVSTNAATEADATVVTITATATEAVEIDQTVDIAISGDVTSGDYSLSDTTITILAGQTVGTATFTVVDDTFVEPTETATIQLENLSPGLVAGSTLSQDVSITDNDNVAVAIAADDSVKPEGDSGDTAFTFTVTRGGDTSIAAQIDYDVIGSSGTPANADDFGGTLPSGTVMFAATETSQTITVNVSGDVAQEGDEEFTVRLINPAAPVVVTTGTALGTIQGDDGPTAVDLAVDTNAASEAATTVVTLTATTMVPVKVDQTVDISVTGTGLTAGDYTLSSGTITILAGQSEGTATFTVVDDSFAEGTETATLSLINLSNGLLAGNTLSQDVAITDNDNVTVSIAADNALRLEGDSGTTPFTFTVTRGGDTSIAAAIDYEVVGSSALPANADDFGGTFPTGTVNFAANETTQTLTIDVVGDTDEEPTEEFTVRLINPAAPVVVIDGTAEGIIEDDDTPIVGRGFDFGTGASPVHSSLIGVGGSPLYTPARVTDSWEFVLSTSIKEWEGKSHAILSLGRHSSSSPTSPMESMTSES